MPSLVEIGSVVLEKKIFLFYQCFFTIFVIIPLGKGCDPSIEQTGITFTQGSFVSSLEVIGPVVLDKKMKL